jgi:hypothetical protein
MIVDVVCAYALGVCMSPRFAVYPSCAACADLPGLPRAWQHLCVLALIPARPYVCGHCKRDYSSGVWQHPFLCWVFLHWLSGLWCCSADYIPGALEYSLRPYLRV